MHIFRTNEEFNTSHIENAFNVPYMFKTQEGINLNYQADPPVRTVQFNLTKTDFFFCHDYLRR